VRRHPEGPRFQQRAEGSGADHRDAPREIPRSAWKAAALGMTPSRKVKTVRIQTEALPMVRNAWPWSQWSYLIRKCSFCTGS